MGQSPDQRSGVPGSGRSPGGEKGRGADTAGGIPGAGERSRGLPPSRREGEGGDREELVNHN